MAQAKSQFIGAAGQFYLSYALAARHINVSLTLGNAPSVDALASSSDGRRTMAIQVKTAKSAKKKRYGRLGYEWYVGGAVIGKHAESFVYALLDFKGDMTMQPDVFFVPSRWVAEFVKPGWKMFLYFLPATAEIEALTKNRFDLVQQYLAGQSAALEWVNAWPEDKLIKWGRPQVVNAD
nr:hypothetical protein [uncultured Cupriavidus sp.]